MQVYSLRHPNAPAKRTQAGQRVCTAVKSVCPCRIWRVRPIVQCQPHRGVYKEEGRYADADPLYKRALATWKKALGPDHPDVTQSLNNLADLYLAQGRYADAEPLYKRALASTPEQKGSTPQFLDAFCLGLKEFGSARFCAGACDQRRIDRADWRGHGHYGRIMTTELEPASLPIHSRAPVGSKRATHFRHYVCSKIDAIRRTVGAAGAKNGCL